LSTVIQTYKNFMVGWQWDGSGKIDDTVTGTTSNFIKFLLQEQLNLARTKRERS